MNVFFTLFFFRFYWHLKASVGDEFQLRFLPFSSRIPMLAFPKWEAHTWRKLSAIWLNFFLSHFSVLKSRQKIFRLNLFSNSSNTFAYTFSEEDRKLREIEENSCGFISSSSSFHLTFKVGFNKFMKWKLSSDDEKAAATRRKSGSETFQAD